MRNILMLVCVACLSVSCRKEASSKAMTLISRFEDACVPCIDQYLIFEYALKEEWNKLSMGCRDELMHFIRDVSGSYPDWYLEEMGKSAKGERTR